MLDSQLAVSDWLLVVVLAIPHLLYAFIWFFPHLWMRAFKKNSAEVFESMAWLLKGKSSLNALHQKFDDLTINLPIPLL